MLRQLHPAVLAAVSLTLLIAVVPPPAGAATRAVFGGVTSQDAAFAVVVDTKAHRLREVDYYIEGKCGAQWGVFGERGRFVARQPNPGSPTDNTFTGGRVRRNGRFVASGRSLVAYAGGKPLYIRQTVSGRIRGRTAHGTLRLHVDGTDAGGSACDDSHISWTAESAPKRIYAGATDEDWPVVLELDDERLSVSVLRLSWHADCPSGAWFAVPDTLKGFSLAGARFADTWTDTIDLDAGGQRAYAYDVRGTVNGRSASGMTMTSVTDTGTAEDETCGPSTTRWTARSS